jgi:hypothetical protein
MRSRGPPNIKEQYQLMRRKRSRPVFETTPNVDDASPAAWHPPIDINDLDARQPPQSMVRRSKRLHLARRLVFGSDEFEEEPKVADVVLLEGATRSSLGQSGVVLADCREASKPVNVYVATEAQARRCVDKESHHCSRMEEAKKEE